MEFLKKSRLIETEVMNEKSKPRRMILSPGKRNQTRMTRMACIMAIPTKLSMKLARIPRSQLDLREASWEFAVQTKATLTTTSPRSVIANQTSIHILTLSVGLSTAAPDIIRTKKNK